MDIHTDIPLKNYITMRLGGSARFMADISTPDEAAALYKRAAEQQLPFYILGGGSNTLVRDDGFPGIVLRMRIPGFEVVGSTLHSTSIRIGAGELWDDIVRRTVEMGLGGIEAMSAIPGTAGAAPVQNIGAYGQEISETLIALDAYDTHTDTFVTLSNEDCDFTYRHSIFRGREAGRYIITSITLELTKNLPSPPFYASLSSYLEAHTITSFTHQTIRDAVIAIRHEKLPDPATAPNTGSFFKNAIVQEWHYEELQKTYPDMPHYDMGDKTYKIPTGWLIEKAGLRGQLLHGIRVYQPNALVLVNESAQTYDDLAHARDEIIATVRDTFRIIIAQEPLEMKPPSQP